MDINVKLDASALATITLPTGGKLRAQIVVDHKGQWFIDAGLRLNGKVHPAFPAVTTSHGEYRTDPWGNPLQSFEAACRALIRYIETLPGIDSATLLVAQDCAVYVRRLHSACNTSTLDADLAFLQAVA